MYNSTTVEEGQHKIIHLSSRSARDFHSEVGYNIKPLLDSTPSLYALSLTDIHMPCILMSKLIGKLANFLGTAHMSCYTPGRGKIVPRK